MKYASGEREREREQILALHGIKMKVNPGNQVENDSTACEFQLVKVSNVEVLYSTHFTLFQNPMKTHYTVPVTHPFNHFNSFIFFSFWVKKKGRKMDKTLFGYS